MLHEDERIGGYTEVEVWQACYSVLEQMYLVFFFNWIYCASLGLPRQIVLEYFCYCWKLQM